MARIRSDKPEAYQSETLAEISLAAERTFKGMATIADDRGRMADKPAQINGELWSMRGNHTRDDLEAELAEMVKVDLVCRYIGCDGKRYLHLVKWDQHQKIDRPSKSRLPRCPHHQPEPDYCGGHSGECVPPEGSHDSLDASRQSREDSMNTREDSNDIGEDSMQDLGSRTVDRGSLPPDARPRETPPKTFLANQLLSDHVAALAAKPPRDMHRQLGEAIDALLDDPEIKPGEITEGLALLRRKPHLGPGALKNLVNEVRQKNADPSLRRPQRPPGQRPGRRGGAGDDLSGEVYGQGRTRI